MAVKVTEDMGITEFAHMLWKDEERRKKNRERYRARACPTCGRQPTANHRCDNSQYETKRGVCGRCFMELNAFGKCGECDE